MNVFYEHFIDLNNVQSDVDITLTGDISEYNSDINELISEREIVNAMESLKNNRACGGDMILNEFLKYSSVKPMPVFVKIFNIVFESGIFPDCWSEIFICPMNKNEGDPASADNCRGITILNCYGKLLTCILKT